MIAAVAADPPTDAFSGIAPEADLISIRQWSAAFSPTSPYIGADGQAQRNSTSIQTLARAIVHAANLGAEVINISE